MINIILSGGSGTRLWPLSRTKLPKQFVPLFNQHSLFQETLIRNHSICSEALIVTNQEHYFLAVDQIAKLADQKQDVEIAFNNKYYSFLLEPIGRNTAPAVALACMLLDPDDIVLVTSSDHLIKNQNAYEQAVSRAKTLAELNNLVTFGIVPTRPETGYGYIEADGNNVLAFKEKPDLAAVQSYLSQKNYYWNSGMFCFKAGIFLEEMQKHSPEIHQSCQQACAELADAKCSPLTISEIAMQDIPSDSIDYAVMEKSSRVKVVPCDIGWSDLGSFDSLYDELKQPQSFNATLLRGDHPHDPITVDSHNNLLITRDRQVALVDVDDLLIIDTTDALLISKKGSAQKVKEVVSQLQGVHPELTEVHRIAHRPWGTYEVLIESRQYKVKRIIVKPGHKLSLQKHYHRNEHWIVVSGTATVTVCNDTYLVRPNESTYIRMGDVHRLENQGRIDLVMVEVQVGEYTGEDDIERIDDHYGR
jgi:mannose-1-phosphate guanylyltransferase